MDEPAEQTTGRSRPLFDDSSRYVDRFGLLLLVTMASIVILSLVDLVEPVDDAPGDIGAVAASVLVALTLLLALRSSGLARRWQRLADALVIATVGIIAIVAATGGRIAGSQTPVSPAPIMIVVLAAIAPVVVVRRLLQHRRVTSGTLQGAISAYLLIPIAYFYAFLALSRLQDAPFFGHVEPTTVFMYFSLTCITTLGFGDVAATSELGRLLAASEAIVGQIYLITFVALLVSLFAQQWRGPGRGSGDVA